MRSYHPRGIFFSFLLSKSGLIYLANFNVSILQYFIRAKKKCSDFLWLGAFSKSTKWILCEEGKHTTKNTRPFQQTEKEGWVIIVILIMEYFKIHSRTGVSSNDIYQTTNWNHHCNVGLSIIYFDFLYLFNIWLYLQGILRQ